jgi:phage/plasmid-associated DNA primase
MRVKALITEDVLTIEGKFKNAVQAPNRLHVFMASNQEWVVPATGDERRFFVLDVADDHRQDHQYFAAIQAELNSGGYGAMLYDLLHHDICNFNVRHVPETAALQSQKMHSMPTEQMWWANVLHRRYVYESELGQEDYFGKWYEWMATDVLYASYSRFAKAQNERHTMGRETFGKFMTAVKAKASRNRNQVVGERMCPQVGAERSELIRQKEFAQGYQLASVDQAQSDFEEYAGVTFDCDRETE